MKFQPTKDIWALSETQIKKLQPGQWVSAGPAEASKDNCGVFCGVKPSGSVVVAWNGNAKSRPSRKAYRRALMDYAKGPSKGY